MDGTKVANIAEVSTSTGAVVTAFGHTANGQVETLLGVGGHILSSRMEYYHHHQWQRRTST